MAGNKKPKKRYKPKNGIGFIQLPVNFRFHQQAETELQLTPMQFMTSFVNGTGDETAWNTVVARLNIGRVLAESHFTDQVDDMGRGLDAMVEINNRHVRTGKWGASKQEYDDAFQSLILCNEMQKLCTRRELRKALEDVYADNNEYHRKLLKIKHNLNLKALGLSA